MYHAGYHATMRFLYISLGELLFFVLHFSEVVDDTLNELFFPSRAIMTVDL